jgi:predicted RNase H-like HicB family nuclease
MTYFICVLDGSDDVWGIRIPDCPGAYGAGSTPEAAVRDAISGLATWAEAALKDGEALPAPRSIAFIKADADDAPNIDAGDVAVMIPLLLDAGRTVRANITMDAGLLAAIDAGADRRGLTRSAFLASAAREKIAAA